MTNEESVSDIDDHEGTTSSHIESNEEVIDAFDATPAPTTTVTITAGEEAESAEAESEREAPPEDGGRAKTESREKPASIDDGATAEGTPHDASGGLKMPEEGEEAGIEETEPSKAEAQVDAAAENAVDSPSSSDGAPSTPTEEIPSPSMVIEETSSPTTEPSPPNADGDEGIENSTKDHTSLGETKELGPAKSNGDAAELSHITSAESVESESTEILRLIEPSDPSKPSEITAAVAATEKDTIQTKIDDATFQVAEDAQVEGTDEMAAPSETMDVVVDENTIVTTATVHSGITRVFLSIALSAKVDYNRLFFPNDQFISGQWAVGSGLFLPSLLLITSHFPLMN